MIDLKISVCNYIITLTYQHFSCSLLFYKIKKYVIECNFLLPDFFLNVMIKKGFRISRLYIYLYVPSGSFMIFF